MPLGVTNYEVSLFIHITAAIIGLGAPFVEGLIYPVAIRLNPRYLPLKHRLQRTINVLLALPALVVVAATGLYQVDEAGFELGDFWLSGALTIVIVLALMLAAYFIPEDRRLQKMVERDIAASGGGDVTLSREYRRRVHIESAAGTLADLLVIAAVYPGGGPS
jgi:hypothetical protein